ncbi:MAG: GTP-binding protein [Candidatus Helarchaeota archaeon]|nr:GTP-binding protein [Candidatus Helarchaeota archaeon]
MSHQILKVLIVGLDNSGKTSIINTLEQKFASYHALKPTVSFNVRDEFTILGLPIKVWDLGGQKQYRDEYLTKKGFIFGETNLLFFVVDVQDPKRYSEAVDYFEKAINLLVKLGFSPIVIVLFHKVDPEIKDSKRILKVLPILKDYFDRLPTSLKIGFFETSIFDRETLSRAFIDGIFKAIPKTAVIQEALNDFMRNTDAEAVVLLDDNVLILGEAYKDETSRTLCQISGPFLSNMTEKLLKYNLSVPQVLEAQMEDGWLFQKPLQVGDTRFYIVFFTKQKFLDKINKYLPRLAEDLSNLIKYVVSPD